MQEKLQHKLLQTAERIAENIYNSRLVFNDEVSWVHKTKGLMSRNAKFSPLDIDFYNGELGLSYFFLHASKHLNKAHYFELAMKLYRSNLDRFIYEIEEDIGKESIERYKMTISPGAFCYPLCLLHLMDHADTLYPENALWDDKVSNIFLEWIEKHLHLEMSVNFFYGLSGCITILLNIYQRRKDTRYSALALKCAEKILAEAKTQDDYLYWPGTDEKDFKLLSYSIEGFGFGNAGIAFGLSKIFAFTKDERFAEAAMKALNCRHEILFPDQSAIELPRLTNEEYNDSVFNGLAGNVWSRLLVNYFSSGVLDENIRFDAVRSLCDGLGHSDSMIFGDTGIIEVLKVLAYENFDTDLENRLNIYLENMIDEYNTSGGFNYGPANPMMGFIGLFDGDAGIAYQMLRFALWDKVPSLLAAEPASLNIVPLHTKLLTQT